MLTGKLGCVCSHIPFHATSWRLVCNGFPGGHYLFWRAGVKVRVRITVRVYVRVVVMTVSKYLESD